MRRLLDAGEIDLALIKREAGDGACLASWKEELVWVGGVSCKVDPDPVSLAVFPVGCIYRERAIRAIEAQGRRWRIAYTSQGLMGVQAAVASGLGGQPASVKCVATGTPQAVASGWLPS